MVENNQKTSPEALDGQGISNREGDLDGSQGSPTLRAPEHSPTPWYKESSGGNIIVYSNDPELESVLYERLSAGDPQKEADLDFILRAVNSYDALVWALQLVVTSGPLNNGLRDENTMAIARAALASSRGEGVKHG